MAPEIAAFRCKSWVCPEARALFPPLGLATLAGYLSEEDEVSLQDEHVEPLFLDDEPDIVVIQVYITSARGAYQLATTTAREAAHALPVLEEVLG